MRTEVITSCKALRVLILILMDVVFGFDENEIMVALHGVLILILMDVVFGFK